MLRIDLAWQTSEEVGLKVAGRLSKEGVALLKGEGQCWLGEVDRLVLDLEELQFIDEEGAELLRGWKERGVRWQGGSIFVRAQLQDYGLG